MILSPLQRFEQNDVKKKIALVVLLFIIPAIIVEIWSVNRLATLGPKISTLEHSKAVLTLENQVLENEIARRSALTEIEDKARAMGFEKIKSVTYLTPENLALK